MQLPIFPQVISTVNTAGLGQLEHPRLLLKVGGLGGLKLARPRCRASVCNFLSSISTWDVVCRYYTVAKHLLMAGGDAMERLMTAYKEVVELAGYTQRVATMFRVFDECAQSR